MFWLHALQPPYSLPALPVQNSQYLHRTTFTMSFINSAPCAHFYHLLLHPVSGFRQPALSMFAPPVPFRSHTPQHVHALRLSCTAVHQCLQRQALFLCQALCISLQASCLQAGIYLLPVQTLSDPDASPAWRINHSAPVVPCRRPRILTVSSWCRRGHTPPAGFASTILSCQQ